MVTMTEDLANNTVTSDKFEDGTVELSVQTRGGAPL
jgi:hypothetical protein